MQVCNKIFPDCMVSFSTVLNELESPIYLSNGKLIRFADEQLKELLQESFDHIKERLREYEIWEQHSLPSSLYGSSSLCDYFPPL